MQDDTTGTTTTTTTRQDDDDEHEPTARERVLESEELLGEIFTALALEDRVGALTNCTENWEERAGAWSSVNRGFLSVFRRPEHWQAVSLFDSEAVYSFCTCFPRGGVASLLIRNSCDAFAAEHPAFVLALRGPWPSLTELDLSHSVLPMDGLLAALEASARTLLRLDISGVIIMPKALEGGIVVWPPAHMTARLGSQGLGSAHEAKRSALLRSLNSLQVLVARDSDSKVPYPKETMSGLIPPHLSVDPSSWICAALEEGCCPSLRELGLGWCSEFLPKHRYERGPGCAPRFNEEPLRAQLPPLLPPHCLRALRSLGLSGYVFLQDSFLAALAAHAAVETLDVCGCRRLTDAGLAAAMTKLAPSLHSLNARGTDFGDRAARAFAAAGGSLRRLNASCTPLSGAGLAALSEAAPPHTLLVLDLCYTQAVAVADVLAVARRHASLQMVGMGGFPDLELGGLAELLERCAPSLDHVGIGGCAALPGDEAFSLLAERLPGLTALSAHKLGGLHGKGVELLFKSCPRLRSLDVADCADLSFRPRGARTCRPLYLEEEVDIPTGQAWTALGTLRVGEHFVLGQVITAVGPVMSGRMPDDHPEDEDGYYDDESDSDDLGGGQGVLGADESSGSDDGDEEGAGVG